MDKKISPNRQKKGKIVAELLEKVNRSKGMIFTNYQGLTHKQLESLRRKVQGMNADFVATKNTLIKLSLNQTKNSSVRQVFDSETQTRGAQDKSQNDKILSDFKNATATLFLYEDPVGPLKEVAKVIKEFNAAAIKFGILDGERLTSEQLLKISALPPREVLLAQLVFGLKSPISNLHRALNWNIQKFVMTLKAIVSK